MNISHKGAKESMDLTAALLSDEPDDVDDHINPLHLAQVARQMEAAAARGRAPGSGGGPLAPSIPSGAPSPQPSPQANTTRPPPEELNKIPADFLRRYISARLLPSIPPTIRPKIDQLNAALDNNKINKSQYNLGIYLTLGPKNWHGFLTAWMTFCKQMEAKRAAAGASSQPMSHPMATPRAPVPSPHAVRATAPPSMDGPMPVSASMNSNPAASTDPFQREKLMQLQQQVQRESDKHRTGMASMFHASALPPRPSPASPNPGVGVPSPPTQNPLGKRMLTPLSTGPPAKLVALGTNSLRGGLRNPSVGAFMDHGLLVNPQIVQQKIQEIVQRYSLRVAPEAVEFLVKALRERLRMAVEQLVIISHHRILDHGPTFALAMTSNPKAMLRDIAQREQEEAREREIAEQKRLQALQASAKDKKELKSKLDKVNQYQEDQKTNMTALSALGDVGLKRTKRRPRAAPSTPDSPAPVTPTSAAGTPSVTPVMDMAAQNKRISYRDVIIFVERDEANPRPDWSSKYLLGSDLLPSSSAGAP